MGSDYDFVQCTVFQVGGVKLRFFSNFKALTLHALRDKMSIFFNLLFPLMILIIFGYVFSGTYSQSTVMAGFTGSKLPQVKGVNYEKFQDLSVLKKAILTQKVDFGLSLEGTLLKIYLNPSATQYNDYYISVGKQVSKKLNKAKGVVSMINVKRKEVSFSGKKLNYLDSLIPGILALSIFSAGIFSMTASLAHLRDEKVMKRLWTTPIARWHFYGAFILEKVVETYISILFLFGVAIIAFGIHYNVDWFKFTLLVVSSIFGTMGMGMIILLFSPNAKVSSEISSVIYTITMFFAGVYFPIKIMPPFLQHVAYSLPLIYMVNAMKYATNIAPMSVSQFYLIVLLMLGGFVVVLTGFSKVFKTD